MLDAKRALLLGISHELRTPLSRMNLSLELLDNEADRERLKPEVTEMEKIITSLLEAERLSTRHEPLSRTRVPINALVENLFTDFFARDRDRLQIDNRVGDLEVMVDAPRIALLVKNLVSNALRYSPADSGPVTVEIDQDGSTLILRVSDSGPGVSAEQAKRIGEPFYRPDPSRARDTGGTGLGLYLAQLVTHAHGGTLELLNPGEPGARFECRIPT